MSLFSRLFKTGVRAADNIPVKPLIREGGHIPVKPVIPESGHLPGKGVPEVNKVVPPDATAISPTGDSGMNPVVGAAGKSVVIVRHVTSDEKNPDTSAGWSVPVYSGILGSLLVLVVLTAIGLPFFLWIRKSTKDSRDV
jgi:hypothetical protein